MTETKTVEVTLADSALAEDVVSAANIVSHDGYYEVDMTRVAETIARHRLASQSLSTDEEVRRLREALVIAAEIIRQKKIWGDAVDIVLTVADEAFEALQSKDTPSHGE